jgi:uncharacterized protein
MITQPLASSGPRHFAVVLQPGERVAESLQAFAEEQGIGAATVTAIGAARGATLGFFVVEKQDYITIEVEEQVEVLSLTGNIARFEGKPRLHLHAVLGRPDGTCVGGHLFDAEIDPTLEVFITVFESTLERSTDSRTGLPLIRASSE